MEAKFIGLGNYIKILNNRTFLKALKNSLTFTLIAVPFLLLISISFALLINRIRGKLKSITEGVILTPFIIPTASIIIFWQIFFYKKDSLLAITIIFIWKYAGYNTILIAAAMSNIPKSLYEAADIDGAGFFAKFKNITLVWLSPALFFVTTISIINSFKIFREIFLLYGEYPDEKIYMLQHFLNNTLRSMNYQKMTTGATIFTLIIVFIVLTLWKAGRRFNGELL